MKQLTEAWFEFNGVRSDWRNVRLLAMPKRPLPAEQGERIEVPGRDGYLWISANRARMPIEITVDFATEDGADVDTVAEWLRGEGLLRFSDEQGRAYRAQVIEESVRENMFLRFDKQRYSVRFTCQPHRYLFPEADDETLYTAGYVTNPCTADSLPRITIEGSGDFTVYIGANQIDVSGGGVIIDSELMDCFELDGMTLANNRVTMEDFPKIDPNGNAVSWDGAVSSVTIRGRWRSL